MKNDADLTIRLPHELIVALKKEAVYSTVSTIVRIAIAEHLARKNLVAPSVADEAISRRTLKERSMVRAIGRKR